VTNLRTSAWEANCVRESAVLIGQCALLCVYLPWVPEVFCAGHYSDMIDTGNREGKTSSTQGSMYLSVDTKFPPPSPTKTIFQGRMTSSLCSSMCSSEFGDFRVLRHFIVG